MKIYLYIFIVIALSACDSQNYQSKKTETNEITTTSLELKNGIAYLPESKEPFTGLLNGYSKESCSDIGAGMLFLEDGDKNNRFPKLGKSENWASIFINSFRKDRPKCIEVSFQSGKLDGTYREWDEYGLIKKSEKNFKDGKLDGLKIFWRDNGQKGSEEHYKKGVKSGFSKSWTEDGNQTINQLFTNNIDAHAFSEATKELKQDHDKVKGITWYHDQSFPKCCESLYLYFGKHQDGTIVLRMVIQQEFDYGLFVNSFTIVADDNRFTLEDLDINRDSTYSGIKEWYDSQVLDKDFSMINAIINSKESIIRFEGDKKVFDYVVTPQEKQSLKTVLDSYNSIANAAN